ncbi:hypothetical protein HDA32_001999 [Spinactinospora alkalitolerans]|uniref:Uncharacterized protein n=1 Tax=Spinactinospora alkalitolerans TaxID=687207 RepID=A0A852TS89_9ACTN|nr:hypothetical protein [Spinactinospora alkalitolerans]NYE46879.1 hypothetical protein [Spinactinospora alkalitolerans]
MEPTLNDLFVDEETLTTLDDAEEYTKKDGSSDQPTKYDEM